MTSPKGVSATAPLPGAAQPQAAKDEDDAVVLCRSLNVKPGLYEGLAYVPQSFRTSLWPW